MRIAVQTGDPGLARSLRACLKSCRPPRCPPDFLQVGSPAELIALAERGDCDLALLGPCPGNTPSPAEPGILYPMRLARILGMQRMILLVRGPCLTPRRLHELGMVGFPYLVFAGEDTPLGLLRVLARAAVRSQLESVSGGSPWSGLSARFRHLLVEGLSGWPPQPDVGGMAEHLDVRVRTLRRKFHRESRGGPKRCLAWSTFLEGAMLYEWGLGSLDRVSRAMGISGGPPLNRRWKKVASEPLSESWRLHPVEETIRVLACDLPASP